MCTRTPGAKTLWNLIRYPLRPFSLSPSFFITIFFRPSLVLAVGGKTETLRILLAHGGDIEQKDQCGKSPLFICAQTGQTATLQILINNGADIHMPMALTFPSGLYPETDSDNSDDGDDGDDRVTQNFRSPVWVATQHGHTDAVHMLLKAGANARTASRLSSGGVAGGALHLAAQKGHLPIIRVLAESWPLDRRPWRMFLMGGGASSELQDYLAPPANRTTKNYLPRLYSKPDMVKEVWKYLHKPRYVDPGQLDEAGETAARIAANAGYTDIVELLQGLGVDAEVDFAAGDGGGGNDSDVSGSDSGTE